ncbi:MAG: hypothetical protein AAFQ65_04560 [Myxococcota bacterium]
MWQRRTVDEALRAAGARVRELSLKQKWKLLQVWRERYCKPLHEQTGLWAGRSGHAWSSFNDSYFPATRGDAAMADYLEEDPATLLVLPDDENTLGFEINSSCIPTFENTFLDVYVVPPDMNWTMVFTHEHPEIGPFFARAKTS